MELEIVMRGQAGVVSRRQVLAVGADDVLIERMIRRRVWARVFEGVYVDHTGPLAWEQRAWAAVLVHQPAALSAGSALRASGVALDAPDEPIEVAVAAPRRVDDPPGVRTSRFHDFDRIIHPQLGPPRMRIEPAALLVAARSRTVDAAVAVLGDVCQQRRTTPSRLLAALETRPRLAHRAALRGVLDDVATGSYSALERRYLVHVERAHGIPTGRRQRRVVTGRAVYLRDVEYLGLGAVIELDGRLGHERPGDRWADLERDLAGLLRGDVDRAARLAAGAGTLSARRRRVATAHCARVVRVGSPLSCLRLNDEGGSPAPGAGDPPRSRLQTLSPCAG